MATAAIPPAIVAAARARIGDGRLPPSRSVTDLTSGPTYDLADARFERLELDERDGSPPFELFELRERFVVRLPDEDEPLLLLCDRLRPPLDEPEDRLRPPLDEPEDRLRPPLDEPEDRLRPPPDEPEDRRLPPDDLAAWARLPLPLREPLSSPDCELFFSSPSD